MFYVYEHWRPDTNACFYVGKGQRRRAYQLNRRNTAHSAVVADLTAKNLNVEVRLVAVDLDEATAFQIERECVTAWRSAGVWLANRTDGGEGHSGFIRPKGIRLSAQARTKMAAARRGMKFSPEHRAKLADAKIGKRRRAFTSETIARMSAAARAREAVKRAIHGDQVRRNSRIHT